MTDSGQYGGLQAGFSKFCVSENKDIARTFSTVNCREGMQQKVEL